MAIYHLSVKPIQRSAGRSSTAAAAYRAGCKIEDHRTGLTHDYSRKTGVVHTALVGWSGSRSELWSAAEQAERRKDATTAREYELALPAELAVEQQIALAGEYAQWLHERHGCAVDLCIHDTGEGNPHAHILTTARAVTPDGALGEKCAREWSDARRKKAGLDGRKADLEEARVVWATIQNRYLAAAGVDARVDHRSHADSGIDRQPTVHVGPTASSMERKGKRTERGDLNRQRQQPAADLKGQGQERTDYKRTVDYLVESDPGCWRFASGRRAAVQELDSGGMWCARTDSAARAAVQLALDKGWSTLTIETPDAEHAERLYRAARAVGYPAHAVTLAHDQLDQQTVDQIEAEYAPKPKAPRPLPPSKLRELRRDHHALEEAAKTRVLGKDWHADRDRYERAQWRLDEIRDQYRAAKRAVEQHPLHGAGRIRTMLAGSAARYEYAALIDDLDKIKAKGSKAKKVCSRLKESGDREHTRELKAAGEIGAEQERIQEQIRRLTERERQQRQAQQPTPTPDHDEDRGPRMR